MPLGSDMLPTQNLKHDWRRDAQSKFVIPMLPRQRKDIWVAIGNRNRMLKLR